MDSVDEERKVDKWKNEKEELCGVARHSTMGRTSLDHVRQPRPNHAKYSNPTQSSVSQLLLPLRYSPSSHHPLAPASTVKHFITQLHCSIGLR